VRRGQGLTGREQDERGHQGRGDEDGAALAGPAARHDSGHQLLLSG
jgi:hypothetical protein